MKKPSQFLACLRRFDDAMAAPFQILVGILASKAYHASELLRDLGCLVLSGWCASLVAVLFSHYPIAQKIPLVAVCLLVAINESKLLLAHHKLFKLGWGPVVSQLYKDSANRYREGFLLFRLAALFGFASIPLFSMVFSSQWEFMDVTTYFLLFIYIWKFYFERSFPSDHSGVKYHSSEAWGSGS